MSHHIKRWAMALLKVAVAGGALAYVFHRVEIGTVWFYIVRSNFFYLALALVSLHIAILVSALRLRTYLSAENMPLAKARGFVIYYIGMFFNTVLPGGIGGDGYLAIHLKRKFDTSVMKMVRILLSSRANGLFFLNICLFVLLMFSDFPKVIPMLDVFAVALLGLQLPVYYLASRYILKEGWGTFWRAGALSVISQAFFTLAALLAFMAVGIDGHYVDYLTLFIVSSIVAAMPSTPGGIGLRELIFYKGATLAGLEPQMAVTGALVYFAVYLATSLTGLVFYIFGNKTLKAVE